MLSPTFQTVVTPLLMTVPPIIAVQFNVAGVKNAYNGQMAYMSSPSIQFSLNHGRLYRDSRERSRSNRQVHQALILSKMRKNSPNIGLCPFISKKIQPGFILPNPHLKGEGEGYRKWMEGRKGEMRIPCQNVVTPLCTLGN
jgi:hypothetical protein